MTQNSDNMILKCLKQIFETEFYVKFQRVLDDLIADSNGGFSIVLNAYNDNLKKSIDKWQTDFPPDFSLKTLAICKAKLFAFRFIHQMGNLLKELIDQKFPSGRTRPEKNLKTLIKVLLYHVLMSKVDSDNFALVELEQISIRLNLSMTELYQRYRSQLLKVIIRFILKKLERHNDRTCCISNSSEAKSAINGDSCNGNGNIPKHNCVIQYMTRAFEIFNMSQITNRDVAESLVIITHMISDNRFQQPITSFLKHLARYDEVDVACLLDKHMQAVMVNLLLRGKMSTYDLTEALKKLSAIAGRRNPRDLLMTRFFRIKGNLLLHYSTDEKKVRSSIEYLSSICQNDELDRPFDGQFDDDSEFIRYISPSMIGILLGIDSYFNQNRGAISPPHGTQYIESITQIIKRLAKEQVQAMHHKILSTFGLILRMRQDRKDQNLNMAIIKMWREFIMHLGNDLSDALTLNICVALYDLIEDCPEKVAVLYEELLLKKSKANPARFQSLFFIPDSPAFRKIYDAITPYVHRGSNKSTLQELESALNCAIPLTKVENQKCHALAATRIRDLLKANQSLLLTSMLANPEKPLNSTISRTVQSILAILTTKDCSALVAECLGVIGAVNPARVNHLIYGNISESEKFLKVPSDEFLMSLIEMLKNSLLSDRTSESEDASYALQVIIEIYNVQKQKWFNELSNEARKACDLCKDTNYAASAKRTPPDMSSPLYIRFKNEGQYSYLDWLDKFFLALLPLVQDSRIREVLQACTYNFKYNLKLAEFLIPVVTTNLILVQDQSLKLIEREFMAIITDDVGVSSQDVETVHRPNFEQNVQTLHYQCANMVFCILDMLARYKKSYWDAKAKSVDKSNPTRRTSLHSRSDPALDQQWNRLNTFTSSLPRDRLAILANRCRAHARSLYYLDHHFYESMTWDARDTTKNPNFDTYWTLLQKVYMALDDNHEAAGVQMRRTSPTATTDDIANLESSGRFDKAVIHYESLLESTDPRLDKKALLQDALKCLSDQGDDQRLYERSKQLLVRYPNYVRSILPAAVEAFCKLGKWEELDRALKGEHTTSIMDSTSICQGRLLNSIVDLDEDVVDQLRVVRKTSVKPLSIAMIDRSAYFRGYQNLLFLHSIEDHSLALEVLKCKQFQTQHLDENTTDKARTELVERLRSLFKTWNTRNKLVQPSIKSLEPLLSWQRSISSVLMKKYPFVRAELSLDVGTMWLESAKIAREARCFDRSFYCIAQAQKWYGSDLLKTDLNLQIECIVAQAKIDWDQGESIEAIRFLKASIQRLQGHGLYQHLEALRNQDEDGRRKENNPYQHPDDESHLEISDITRDNACQECCSFNQTERESFAKLKLLLTKFTEEAAASTPRSLITMYGECVHLGVNQEEVFLLLARYYDKLANYYTENPEALRVSDRDLASTCNDANSCVVRSARDSATKTTRGKSASQEKKEKEIAHKEEVISKLMEQSIFAFGHSLKYGVKYLEESLPRMLNIWYDLCSKKCLEKMSFYPRAINSRIEKTFRLLDSLLLKDSSSLPSYYCVVALSLLLSRVCHPHPGANQRTHSLLAQLLKDYPHQMMWRLASLSNDDVKERKTAYENITRFATKNNPDLARLIKNYITFIGQIRSVTKNYSELDTRTDKDRGRTLRAGPCQIVDIEPSCKREIEAKIITPTQTSINPILPSETDCVHLKQYNIYPDRYMSYIRKFEPEVHVYNSLQRPRRVGLSLHDGKNIHVICKVGDDLRKDSRCIEFFNLLNRILHRGSQSNVRFLEIATFLVLPLENRAGLIEMVPNCVTFRSIIETLYREELGDNFTTGDYLKKHGGRGQVADAELYQHFLEKVLPKMKLPVFQRYLQRRFTDPTTWYMARLAYTRSTALISIAGYIIGLGDRHLDNILIDAAQGRIVHVDFNLLFHQADFLPVPEVVPFRLTRNVVAGFGPMGTEGNFRRYCEIAMRTMRNEKELLLTTLKPFLHDPCCDWTKDREQNRKTKDVDQHRDGNKTARDRIDVVEKKLRGFPKPGGPTKPLTVLNAFSVEAQVDILIEEATNLWNLSQMYFGWAPHC